ncbi:helix-turn-helix domain-containing protein [Paenibacillus pinihumi]|uniref:helix-turn-helix domain-containing protein n=1 Tax=Paenibacillus pinihumi TaxID=669462 RepID=UPI000563D3B9|nr:helix-turn-helix domain-containing protein [Paenibacillus pinihumi]
MSMQQFNFISLQETLDLLGISRSTFDRWRKQKQLPYRKIGKEIWVDKQELEGWLRRQQVPELSASPPNEELRNQGRLQVIHIGYQSRSIPSWTAVVMKSLGWFEEELRSSAGTSGVQVCWHDAANGPELVQAMVGGNIHIASLDIYPLGLSFSLRQMLPDFRPVLLAAGGWSMGSMNTAADKGLLSGITADEVWAARHPASAVACLKAHLRVQHFMRTEPDFAVELIARARHLPLNSVRAVMDQIRWETCFIEEKSEIDTAGDSPEKQPSASGVPFKKEDSGSIPYHPEYLRQAMELVKLPHNGYVT